MSQKKNSLLVLLLLAGFSLLFSGLMKQETAKELFEKALYLEETKGELEQAIEIYTRVVKEFPDERATAAKAQFHIGLCFEKLGHSEAVKAYELVLKNYADQPEQVSAARARLAELREKKPAGMRMVRLLPPEVFLDCQYLSPDGSKVVGVDFSVGQNIAVFDIATGQQELITHFDWGAKSRCTYFPVWSPDGKEIAYSTFSCWGGSDDEAVELKASTLIGESRLIYRNEDGIIWACDWMWDGSAIVTILQNSDKSYTLGLVPAIGGSFKALHNFKKNIETRLSSPASVSPDGRFIVFEDGPQDGDSDIFIITTDGKSLKTLTDHPADDSDPRWSPDGKHIVFLSRRHGGLSLWGVVMKDGRPEAQPFMIEGMQDASLANWTQRGLYYKKLIIMRDVFVMNVDPDDGEPTSMPKNVDYTPSGGNVCPVWSPDGKYLAFASDAVDRPSWGYIVVLPASGGEARKFLIPTDNYWSPGFHDLRWLPDSSGLGFSHRDNKGQYSLFRLKLATGEWKTWPIPVKSWTRIEWSPDGESFLYARQGFAHDESGIIEHNLKTGEERYFYRGLKDQDVFRRLKFSMDYKWLAFEGPKDQIFVVETETGKARKITEKLGSPAWSPDGQNLVALGDFNKNGFPVAVYILPVTDGPEKKLDLGIRFPKGTELFDPDWSPDGTKITFVTRLWKYDTILIENVIPKNK